MNQTPERRKQHPYGRRRIDRADAFADRSIRNPTFLLMVIAVLVLGAILQQFSTSRSAGARARENIAETRTAVAQTRQASEDIKASLRILEDCTETAGACTKRNQAQTQALVQGLVKATVAAGLCSVISDTAAKYNACIKEQTKEGN